MNEASPLVRVTGLDHIVLIVADIERALAWYCGELGLDGVRVDEWRSGHAPFPSARVSEGAIIDFFAGPPGGADDAAGRNLDHLCLVIDAIDLHGVAASGRFEVVDGPGARFGARGLGTSVYVKDPDGNTVELRHY